MSKHEPIGNQRFSEKILRASGGGPRFAASGTGGDSRSAGAKRSGQNHDLPNDHRHGQARRGDGDVRWDGCYPYAHVQTSPSRYGVVGPGAECLSAADGGR